MTRLGLINALERSSFADAPETGVIRGCKPIRVIEVTFNRGLGVEGDPVRIVTQLWSMDGTLLVEQDTWAA